MLQNEIFLMKIVAFLFQFLGSFWSSNWHLITVGLGIGLKPDGKQATEKSNDDPVH